MRRRQGRIRGLLLAGAALTALATGVAPLPAAARPTARQPDPGDDQPLKAAGEAARRVSFVGVLQMRWWGDGKEHTERLLVEGADGAVVVRGGTSAMASPQYRMVEHEGVWDLLWLTARPGKERPDPAQKYQVGGSPSDAVIAGRATRIVQVNQGSRLLERLYLDVETGLLLRRESFDDDTRPVRSIGFETVTIGTSTAAPSTPGRVVNAAPRAIAAGHLPGKVSAPAGLDDGYRQVGVYRRSGVTQVLYSDGLYDLSIFQEGGRLDRKDLPAGDKLRIGNRSGWHYGWPGGHVVLWEAGGVVHTAVSDAPLEQVLAAVRSMPVRGGGNSLLHKLRRVCRALVQPLAD